MLMKLDTLTARQEQQDILIRQLLNGQKNTGNDQIVEDVLSRVCDTQEELEDFSNSLDNPNYRKKVVSSFVLKTVLRIDTGDRIWYAVIAIKMLFWNRYSPCIAKLWRFSK